VALYLFPEIEKPAEASFDNSPNLIGHHPEQPQHIATQKG
jgi:hypothetical protein